MSRVLGQFWRLLKLCISGEGGKFGLVLYAIVLALELSQILVSLRMIEWSKVFYDALQQMNGAEALTQVGVFGIVFTGVALTMASTYARKHLEIRWRRSLTNAAMSRWLSNRSYLKLERERFGSPDNPDQRIAEDCRFFLAGPMGEHGGGVGIIPLSLDLITNVVAIFSYLAVLWSIATFALPLGLPASTARSRATWSGPPSSMSRSPPASPTCSAGRSRAFDAEQQRREADFRLGSCASAKTPSPSPWRVASQPSGAISTSALAVSSSTGRS